MLGHSFIVNGESLLGAIDAQEAIERALSDRALARAADGVQQREGARDAAVGDAGEGSPIEPALTREDVAQLLRCSVRTVQRLEESGRLRRCAGLVRLVRFERTEVQRFLSVREVAAS